ncbi:K(+)-transporting ATPase subunit C [Sphingobacterium faecale]|uniref:Potassium-transporting ATPase KdpC subunit n=1 Tax=Sphingobacterium faecale TaxID=2803775 RepID=A0ABS1QXK2_9SPHI|nr:K(+)-transporting ATPase subunit C [Sphingobacterium faecale]MBL1407158.1 K(+)-transporting ATPase subunit C [Sphingobacterium faecale]
MKTNILPAIKLTLALLVLFVVAYPVLLWGIGQLSNGKGKGVVVVQDGKTYYKNIGQSFKEAKYFWSRPSAVDYNAAGSGASNKGPNEEAYLATVEQRIADFLQQNPGVSVSDIPVDLVTASGSGLDPHISVAAARVQVARIAQQRNLKETQLMTLIGDHVEQPLLGLLGPEKVNVLMLNLALDSLDSSF